jgi:hypothetical protein
MDASGQDEAREVEIRPSRVLGAGLGIFLRRDLPAGRVVLREHVLVAPDTELGVSTAWGLTLALLLHQQATGSLPDWVAALHDNEPFASRQLQDTGDRRMLARLARGRGEVVVRKTFNLVVTNHFAHGGVAWLGPLSSRFNHGPQLVGNPTPGPRLVPKASDLAGLAGRLGVLAVPGLDFGVLEWVLTEDASAGQELTFPYGEGYSDF